MFSNHKEARKTGNLAKAGKFFQLLDERGFSYVSTSDSSGKTEKRDLSTTTEHGVICFRGDVLVSHLVMLFSILADTVYVAVMSLIWIHC